MDWEAAACLLKGVYLTLRKSPFIVHATPLRSLITTCQVLQQQLSPSRSHTQNLKKIKNLNFHFKIQSLILGDLSASMSAVDGGSPIHSRGGGAGTARRSSLAPPPAFSSIVVQLVAMQILALGVSFEPVPFGLFLKKKKTPKKQNNFDRVIKEKKKKKKKV